MLPLPEISRLTLVMRYVSMLIPDEMMNEARELHLDWELAMRAEGDSQLQDLEPEARDLADRMEDWVDSHPAVVSTVHTRTTRPTVR